MKKLTEAAQAAKLIKKELKEAFPDIKFRVTGSTFSDGSDVHIVCGRDAEINEDEIYKISDKYLEGEFNGMTDSYEYTNLREDIPQVKFVFLVRNMAVEEEES